jgi:hypothetical protein
LIVQIHAQETDKLMSNASGLEPDAKKWWDQSFAMIQRCAPIRFDGRGAYAYQESLALFQKYRDRLDPLVLELGDWRRDPGTRVPAGAHH